MSLPEEVSTDVLPLSGFQSRVGEPEESRVRTTLPLTDVNVPAGGNRLSFTVRMSLKTVEVSQRMHLSRVAILKQPNRVLMALSSRLCLEF